jgi:hypothetical protein
MKLEGNWDIDLGSAALLNLNLNVGQDAISSAFISQFHPIPSAHSSPTTLLYLVHGEISSHPLHQHHDLLITLSSEWPR